jgi:RimJ/RimL family protein N-acetyltransferase
MARGDDPVEVAGPDLTLRPWRRTDEQRLVSIANDHDIDRFMVLMPQPYTPEHARQWVRDLAPEVWQQGGATFALDVGDGLALGGIGIDKVERGCIVTGSIGYWVAPASRGNGLAARALKMLAPWAAEHLGLTHQQLIHDVENLASCKTAFAAGFTTTKVLYGGDRHRDGRPRDVERHEWTAPPPLWSATE